MTPKVTDKFIIIQISDADLFEESSFRTLSVKTDKGIDGVSEIMGKVKDSNETKVQSYLFDKNTWTIEEARAWVKNHIESGTPTQVELAGRHKTIVTASVMLCESKPNMALQEPPKPLPKEEKLAMAHLNDKYYFYVEGVHEGKNKNGDVFFRDELVKNYKSAGFQLIDWEHLRDQVIGFTLESELITSSDPEEPVAVAFNGVLNRLSPFMQIEEDFGGRTLSRDEVVRQRYFEDKLAISMECYFDSMKCDECGFATDDAMEFEFHTIMSHGDILDRGETVGRGLVGVDFCGWGVVEFPADREAFPTSLRTSDDGTIQEIISDAILDEGKYGLLAANVAFSNLAVASKPSDTLINGHLKRTPGLSIAFASEKCQNMDPFSTKTVKVIDNKLEESSSTLGGTIMLKLAEKIKEKMTLSEILVVAQDTLREVKGKNPLEAEAVEAFATELAEVVKAHVGQEGFQLGDTFSVTKEAMETAVKAARTEEKAVAQSSLDELQVDKDALTKEVGTLKTSIADKVAKIGELECAEEKRAADEKVNVFMDDLSDAGITFSSDIFEKDIRSLVAAKIDDKEALKGFKESLVGSYKQSTLSEASDANGGLSNSGDPKPSGLEERIEAAKKKLNANK